MAHAQRNPSAQTESGRDRDARRGWDRDVRRGWDRDARSARNARAARGEASLLLLPTAIAKLKLARPGRRRMSARVCCVPLAAARSWLAGSPLSSLVVRHCTWMSRMMAITPKGGRPPTPSRKNAGGAAPGLRTCPNRSAARDPVLRTRSRVSPNSFTYRGSNATSEPCSVGWSTRLEGKSGTEKSEGAPRLTEAVATSARHRRNKKPSCRANGWLRVVRAVPPRFDLCSTILTYHQARA